MDLSSKSKHAMQPKNLAELLPELRGIFSVNTVITNTARKQKTLPRTVEKMKPLTLAEMKGELLALTQSPRRSSQQDISTKKKGWNTSVKVVNKTKSDTSERQIKHNSFKKVLNFQSKTRTPDTRAAIINTETPKRPNPIPVKKSLHIPRVPNIRISGVCNLPETPVTTNKLVKNKLTMQHNFNKENNSYLSNINIKKMVSPNPNFNINPLIPDTPISPNMSYKSCDASFLQKEKEINDVEEKMLVEKPILENIAEISPPVSTPFKDYRNVKDFFNNSNENSVLYNDTIMFLNEDTEHKDRRDESVIVSTVNSSNSTELSVLLDIKKQTENSINMIKTSVRTLQNMQETQENTLKNVIKLINEKSAKKISETENDTTVVAVNKTEVKIKQRSPMLRASELKIKSPSYKIPKKNLCWRKKVFHKSMLDETNAQNSRKEMINDKKLLERNDKVLNMYLEIKEKMNFLNTPKVKHDIKAIDTPTVTSYNLQMQIDKLYNAS